MGPRISVFPKCYINDIGPGKAISLSDWIEMSGDIQVDGLELYPTFLNSFETDYLKTVRSAVETKGMRIAMFCCSPDLSHPDPDSLAREMALQGQYMRAAATLGCDTCRVLSGQRHPAMPVGKGIGQVVSCIRTLLPLARTLGITLAMENHYKDGIWRYPEFAQKKDIFLRIIEAIDDPCFGVQYDPSNAIVAGDDPIALLEAVKHRMVSMHASDRFLLPGHSLAELAASDGDLGYHPIIRHGEIGKGLNDYDRIFSILAEIRYQGWISIEDGENGLDEMKRSADFLKEKRRQYLSTQ
jgi:sugar phosphate isomerase/epimerase